MKNVSFLKILFMVVGISLSVFLLYRLIVTDELSKSDYFVMVVLLSLSLIRRVVFGNQKAN
ncbi:MAG: hypothetical protein RIM99_20000 [Cyclobacteriaceae bacterium]